MPQKLAVTKMGQSQDPPLTNKKYFLHFIIFKVEDTLFQVPRINFEQIEAFSTAFKLPPAPGSAVEGLSESSPVTLHGISKDDFQGFLSVLYPLSIPCKYEDIPVDTWKSALKLSSMWEFDSIRKLAIAELSKPNALDDVSKILQSIKYGIPQWFISGCEQLVLRQTGPREPEMGLLSADLIMMIWDLRERRLKFQHSIVRENPPFNLTVVIATIFNERHNRSGQKYVPPALVHVPIIPRPVPIW